MPLFHYVKKRNPVGRPKGAIKKPRKWRPSGKHYANDRLKHQHLSVLRRKQRIPDHPSVGNPPYSIETDGTDLVVGERVWAKDVRLIWCLAHVLLVTQDHVRVHFTGWTKKFDEDMPMGCGDLLKLGAYPVNSHMKRSWPGPPVYPPGEFGSGDTSNEADEADEADDSDNEMQLHNDRLKDIPAVMSCHTTRLWDLNCSSDDELEVEVDAEEDGEEYEDPNATNPQWTDEEDKEEDEEVEKAASGMPRNEGGCASTSKTSTSTSTTPIPTPKPMAPPPPPPPPPPPSPPPYVETIPGAAPPVPDEPPVSPVRPNSGIEALIAAVHSSEDDDDEDVLVKDLATLSER